MAESAAGAEKHAPAKRGRKWHIAAKRSKVKAIEDETLRAQTEQIEHIKASIRTAVEHPFRVVKRQFGHVRARYRGLAKNGAQVLTLVCAEQSVDGAANLVGDRSRRAPVRRVMGDQPRHSSGIAARINPKFIIST